MPVPATREPLLKCQKNLSGRGRVRARGGVLARPRAEPMRVPATNDGTICETGHST